MIRREFELEKHLMWMRSHQTAWGVRVNMVQKYFSWSKLVYLDDVNVSSKLKYLNLVQVNSGTLNQPKVLLCIDQWARQQLMHARFLQFNFSCGHWNLWTLTILTQGTIKVRRHSKKHQSISKQIHFNYLFIWCLKMV